MVCHGADVTFHATAVNGGTSPLYQWYQNGTPIGSNTDSLVIASPADQDFISCQLISSETCVTGNPAISNVITMTVNPGLPAGVSILASANPSCIGTSVTFTASPVNGGTSPSFQWRLNGAITGTNSPAYTNASLVTGDKVKCWMASNATCVTGSPTASNIISMIVNPLPVVHLGHDTIICTTWSITLDAGTGFWTYLWTGGSTNQTLLLNGDSLGIGSWPYSVEVSNIYNCFASDTMVVNVDICSGTVEPPEDMQISCYPNPADDEFTVSIIGMGNTNFGLRLLNMYGQMICREELTGVNGSIVRQIGLSGYSKGVYYLEISAGNKVYMNKIVKE
jgi:hypothetical protein